MPIYRTTDIEDILSTISLTFPDGILGFDPEQWIKDDKNICLTDGNKNFTLFEYNSKGVVTGHYFFVYRGKAALSLCKEMLREIFSEKYNDIKVIKGLTPLEKLGARWMNKQLGFKSYGVVFTLVGPCELVMLTKEEWKGLQE